MYHERETSWGEIGILIALLIVTLIVSRGCSSARYNNGICSQCGGKYVYQQAVGHEYFTHYIYRCEKCGKTIEVDTVFPEYENIGTPEAVEESEEVK